MSYLRPDDIVAMLDTYAKPTARGFQAVCPVHEDRSPSLSISEGNKATLIYCHAGCTLDELGDVIGFTRQQLFHDYSPNGGGGSSLDRVMRQMIRDARPVDRLRTLGDVMLRAFGFTDEAWAGLALARWQYPELTDMEYEKAIGMYHVVMSGPVHTFLQPWSDVNPGKDWFVVRKYAMARLFETWREHYA